MAIARLPENRSPHTRYRAVAGYNIFKSKFPIFRTLILYVEIIQADDSQPLLFLIYLYYYILGISPFVEEQFIISRLPIFRIAGIVRFLRGSMFVSVR